MISVDAARAFWILLRRRADDIDDTRSRGSRSWPFTLYTFTVCRLGLGLSIDSGVGTVVRRSRPWKVSQVRA